MKVYLFIRLKFTLGNELHLKKQYKKELSTIFKQIIEKEKNEIKNYNNFMEIKANYEHFMNSLFVFNIDLVYGNKSKLSFYNFQNEYLGKMSLKLSSNEVINIASIFYSNYI